MWVVGTARPDKACFVRMEQLNTVWSIVGILRGLYEQYPVR
jgi:hypothetical protein